jgi:hypothetical protein
MTGWAVVTAMLKARAHGWPASSTWPGHRSPPITGVRKGVSFLHVASYCVIPYQHQASPGTCPILLWWTTRV